MNDITMTMSDKRPPDLLSALDHVPALLSALDHVPEHMHSAVVRYVLHGTPPGDFLHAVFCNNLMRAAILADHENRRCLDKWALVMHWMPAGSVGSLDAVHAWRGITAADHAASADQR